MSNQIPLLGLSLILWIFLGYRFLRAFTRRRLTDRASLYAWIVFFLCYLVVALDVPSVEQVLNQRFGDLPVTALIRNVAVLVTAHVFFIVTRHVDAPSHRMKRLFSWINPSVIVITVLLFVWMAEYRQVFPRSSDARSKNYPGNCDARVDAACLLARTGSVTAA